LGGLPIAEGNAWKMGKQTAQKTRKERAFSAGKKKVAIIKEFQNLSRKFPYEMRGVKKRYPVEQK